MNASIQIKILSRMLYGHVYNNGKLCMHVAIFVSIKYRNTHLSALLIIIYMINPNFLAHQLSGFLSEF